MHICIYIGCNYAPDGKGINSYVDDNFADGWDQSYADNVESVGSRTGYIIKYVGCSVLWCSKLQTEVALSTT